MRVIVGVSGGIAAYKAAELVRLLERQAIDVRVAMTRAACEFVTPLTFASLSGHPVVTSLWASGNGEPPIASPDAADAAAGRYPIEHIEYAQSAHLLVVAPATANILAKFAQGIADDFLTTLYLATKAPVIVAPAMNVNMWNHSATQANLDALSRRGVVVVPPGSGYLACGMTGDGRMAEPEAIVRQVLARLHRAHDFSGETVLITAGGTREAIDPVRFLGNRSSGKMGYALAEAAASRGADVVLIAAPTSLSAPSGCEVVPVVSAEEMRRAVLDRLDCATIVIKAAAVADYRPRLVEERKIPREGPLSLDLEPTGDILAEVVRRKRPGTLVVGFAAETGASLDRSREKLRRKGADALIVNDITSPQSGFDSDWNSAVILTPDAEFELPRMLKTELAEKILDRILTLQAAKKA